MFLKQKVLCVYYRNILLLSQLASLNFAKDIPYVFL